MAPTSMNLAGNVTEPCARLITTWPSSSGWRSTSSPLWPNSGSSSRKRTLRWASLQPRLAVVHWHQEEPFSGKGLLWGRAAEPGRCPSRTGIGSKDRFLQAPRGRSAGAMDDLGSLRIWQEADLRGQLSWYRRVSANRAPAKFRIARHIPVEISLEDAPEAALREALEEKTPAFLDLWERIRRGSADLPTSAGSSRGGCSSTATSAAGTARWTAARAPSSVPASWPTSPASPATSTTGE